MSSFPTPLSPLLRKIPHPVDLVHLPSKVDSTHEAKTIGMRANRGREWWRVIDGRGGSTALGEAPALEVVGEPALDSPWWWPVLAASLVCAPLTAPTLHQDLESRVSRKVAREFLAELRELGRNQAVEV